MKTTRQAIMKVTREQLEVVGVSFLPSCKNVHELLDLPDNAMVVSLSGHLYFDEDLVAVKIQCPDFIETAEGCKLPEVFASMNMNDEFDWWYGPAITSAISFTWQPEAAVQSPPSHQMERCSWVGKQTTYLGLPITIMDTPDSVDAMTSLVRIKGDQLTDQRTASGSGRIIREKLDVMYIGGGSETIDGIVSATGSLQFTDAITSFEVWQMDGTRTIMTQVEEAECFKQWVVVSNVLLDRKTDTGVIHWRSNGPFTVWDSRKDALVEFARLLISGPPAVKRKEEPDNQLDALALSFKLLEAKPGQAMKTPVGTLDVVRKGNLLEVQVSDPLPGALVPLVCICPAADMLGDGWRCTCGADL